MNVLKLVCIDPGWSVQMQEREYRSGWDNWLANEANSFRLVSRVVGLAKTAASGLAFSVTRMGRLKRWKLKTAEYLRSWFEKEKGWVIRMRVRKGKLRWQCNRFTRHRISTYLRKRRYFNPNQLLLGSRVVSISIFGVVRFSFDGTLCHNWQCQFTYKWTDSK